MAQRQHTRSYPFVRASGFLTIIRLCAMWSWLLNRPRQARSKGTRASKLIDMVRTTSKETKCLDDEWRRPRGSDVHQGDGTRQQFSYGRCVWSYSQPAQESCISQRREQGSAAASEARTDFFRTVGQFSDLMIIWLVSSYGLYWMRRWICYVVYVSKCSS